MSPSLLRAGATLLALAAAAGPAWAVQDPSPGRYDARVRTIAYNPMNVVRVVGGTLPPPRSSLRRPKR